MDINIDDFEYENLVYSTQIGFSINPIKTQPRSCSTGNYIANFQDKYDLRKISGIIVENSGLTETEEKDKRLPYIKTIDIDIKRIYNFSIDRKYNSLVFSVSILNNKYNEGYIYHKAYIELNVYFFERSTIENAKEIINKMAISPAGTITDTLDRMKSLAIGE
ncbi:MAG: hypothetical protein E3K37_01250 [Candidatus Kuenenia sp.]|nr:hypothetical protein [Candidatus Kuenenia hertensis]